MMMIRLPHVLVLVTSHPSVKRNERKVKSFNTAEQIGIIK